MVGGDLGDEFVGGYAQGSGEAYFLANLALKLAGQFDGGFPRGHQLGDVQVGLVDTHLFDEGGGPAQDLHDAPGIVAVEGKAGRQDHSLGAEDQGAGHGHGRSHAKGAGRVRRRSDDAAPLGMSADEHRLASQLWIFKDLDAGMERIGIQMDDSPCWFGHVQSFRMVLNLCAHYAMVRTTWQGKYAGLFGKRRCCPSACGQLSRQEKPGIIFRLRTGHKRL